MPSFSAGNLLPPHDHLGVAHVLPLDAVETLVRAVAEAREQPAGSVKRTHIIERAVAGVVSQYPLYFRRSVRRPLTYESGGREYVAVSENGRPLGEASARAKYTDAETARVLLFRHEGYTVAQVAEMMDMPARTVIAICRGEIRIGAPDHYEGRKCRR